jgi:hypothetical protein
MTWNTRGALIFVFSTFISWSLPDSTPSILHPSPPSTSRHLTITAPLPYVVVSLLEGFAFALHYPREMSGRERRRRLAEAVALPGLRMTKCAWVGGGQIGVRKEDERILRTFAE